ncbi:MAG: serine/threonine-protein kinase, partial [Balneolaceae bacterium]
MKEDRWSRMEMLIEQALELPAGQRTAFLEQECHSDPDMLHEVKSLISNREQADRLIDEMASDGVSEMLAGLFSEQDSHAGSDEQKIIGRRIGHYQILRKLGSGGMGVVYKARDTKLDRDVALKFLPSRLVTGDKEKERCRREAKAAAALNHPNICTIHNVDEYDDNPFIVMEYIDGSTLRDVLKSEIPEPSVVLDYAAQMADALHKAHGAGIIHRDIKPANIMITDEGLVKILDFGIAKTLQGSAAESTIMGSPAYMSPEQALGEEVDHRTDIWSLGVIIYEMITGKKPYHNEDERTLIYMILNGTIVPLRSHVPDIDPEIDQIIQRALQKNKEERYSSAAEMLDEVKQYRDRFLADTAGAFDLQWILRSFRKPRVAISSAAGVLAMILLAIWYYDHQKNIFWAHAEAKPEIERLLGEHRFSDAFFLSREALNVLPDDQELQGLLETSAALSTIITDPEGARFYYKSYYDPDDPWITAGITPLEEILLPKETMRWRVEKEGYETAEGHFSPRFRTLTITLLPEEEARAGMVWVPLGSVDVAGELVELDPF